MKNLSYLTFAIILILNICVVAQQNNKESLIDLSKPYVEGELLVKFSAGIELNITDKTFRSTSSAKIDTLLNTTKVYSMANVYRRSNLPPSIKNTVLIKFPKSENIDYIIKSFLAQDDVEWVCPNYIVKADTFPDSQHGNWWIEKIKAPQAWDISTGDTSVVIAVLDTGIDYFHEDLADNVWNNWNEIPDNGIDDDDNGYIDDYLGYDFMNGDNDPIDDDGHGSHVSGIIGAVGNNWLGVVGMNWQCRLMGLKVLDSSGGGNLALVHQAIEYAIINRADVINMSIGTDSGVPWPYMYIIADAFNNGIVVVRSAGNNYTVISSDFGGNPEIIIVAATDEDDKKAGFSNYGEAIDVSAPGTNIISAWRSSGVFNYYALASGTSASAPMVSGLAGLLLSANPSLSPAKVTDIIVSSTDNIDSQNPDFIGQLGSGRINAYSAILKLFTFRVKVIPEGLYNPITNTLRMKDTVKAYLRDLSPPYSIVDSAVAIIDSVSFICNFHFLNAQTGSYYLVIKHRNSIETWTRIGGEVFLRATPSSYDFTDDSSKSFGNNMIKKGDKWCIYSGDVNQDGIVDVSDVQLVVTENLNFEAGYRNTDINGDLVTDISDVSAVVTNNLKFITEKKPK